MTITKVLLDDIILRTFIIVLILSFVIIAYILSVVKPFVERRDFIKMEMQRTMGPEHFFWKRELKLLYISHIPFVGKLLFRYLNKK